MFRASFGDSEATATAPFAYRPCFATPACAWTFSMAARTITSRTSANASRGQFWNILATDGGDQVRLTTKFRGTGMCLDIFNGGANYSTRSTAGRWSHHASPIAGRNWWPPRRSVISSWSSGEATALQSIAGIPLIGTAW